MIIIMAANQIQLAQAVERGRRRVEDRAVPRVLVPACASVMSHSFGRRASTPHRVPPTARGHRPPVMRSAELTHGG
jgi:hypothetical protein